MLKNARFTAFTVSELLWEKQQQWGIKIPPILELILIKPFVSLKKSHLILYG